MSLENVVADQTAERIQDDEAAYFSADPWYNEGPGQFPASGRIYETGKIPWGSTLEDAEILIKEQCSAKGQPVVWVFQWKHPHEIANYLGMQDLVLNLNRARELACQSWGLIESVERYGITEPILLHAGLIEGSHRLWTALAIGLEQVPVLSSEIVSETGYMGTDCSNKDRPQALQPGG